MCGERERPRSDVSEQSHPQTSTHRRSFVYGRAAGGCEPEDQQHAAGILGGKVPAGADQRRRHQDARRLPAGHGAAHERRRRYRAPDAVRVRRGGLRRRLREGVLRHGAGAHVPERGLHGHQLSRGHVVAGEAVRAGRVGRPARLRRLPGGGLLHRERHHVARLEDARELAAGAAELRHALCGRHAGAAAAVGAPAHRHDPNDGHAGAAERVHPAGRRRLMGRRAAVRRRAAAGLPSACVSVVSLGLADAPVSAERLAAVH